jgi:hypothetical protein
MVLLWLDGPAEDQFLGGDFSYDPGGNEGDSTGLRFGVDPLAESSRREQAYLSGVHLRQNSAETCPDPAVGLENVEDRLDVLGLHVGEARPGHLTLPRRISRS